MAIISKKARTDQNMNEELAEAIYWYNRLKRGEDLHLHDLCISTLQRNVGVLMRSVKADYEPPIYRSLCPGCGRTVELQKE